MPATLISSSVPTVTAGAITLPPHVAGDLIVMHVHASALNTLPIAPGGGAGIPLWTQARSTGGTNYSNARLVWGWGTASTTSSGTWTNADQFIVAVLRNVNPTNPIGGSAISPVTASTSCSAPAITLVRNDGSSQILHFHSYGDGVNAVGTIGAAPSGTTQRVAIKLSAQLGGILNTKNVTTTGNGATQSATGFVWNSGASIEVRGDGVAATPTNQFFQLF
jgi:hypothetical protein